MRYVKQTEFHKYKFKMPKYKLTKEQNKAKTLLFKLIQKSTTKPEMIREILEEHDIPIDIEHKFGETLLINASGYSCSAELLDWLYKNGSGFGDKTEKDFMYNIMNIYNRFSYVQSKMLLTLQMCKNNGFRYDIGKHFKIDKDIMNIEDCRDWVKILMCISRTVSKSTYQNSYLTPSRVLYYIILNYDISEKDKNGDTFLHYYAKYNIVPFGVVFYNDKKIKKYRKNLYDFYHYSDRELTDKKLNTYHKISKSISDILQKNDINAINYDGDTASHIAVKNDHYEVLAHLYIAGADFETIRDSSGQTVMDYLGENIEKYIPSDYPLSMDYWMNLKNMKKLTDDVAERVKRGTDELRRYKIVEPILYALDEPSAIKRGERIESKIDKSNSRTYYFVHRLS